ncbi:MAG: tetratricopeptide repeat protein [Methanoregula sp.]|nr:tetratricopeptide repeat protein [Methanoregula sp.]
MSTPDFPYQDQAARLAQEGKVSEALDCYDRALKDHPDNDAILNKKAIALISLCRFEEAYATAKRAAAVNPSSVDVWITMGVALEKLDRLGEAAKAFRHAISLDPYHAYARAMLGIIYEKMDMPDEAETQNRKLQEIVFPKGYAGVYFATASFLLGMLLGGIWSVEGKPPEITIPSQVIILFFFLLICGLYRRSHRMLLEINRHVSRGSCQPAAKTERDTKSMYLILAGMVIVFVTGILIGHTVWDWLH